MQIRMLLFALYGDLAGVREVEVDVSPGSTARDAVQRLRGLGPAFARLPAEPAVAINQEYAGLDTGLSGGDEVALIPPVAGG